MPAELKQACRRMQERSRGLRLRVPDRPATVAAARKLDGLPRIESLPKLIDLDALAREIVMALRSAMPLSRRQLRISPWCLWSCNPALAEYPDALGSLIEQWDLAARSQTMRALASSFVTHYGPDQSARDRVAGFLVTLAAKFGGPWSDLHARYAIFDLERGPRELARAVLSSGRAPAEIVRDFGLGEIVAKGGLTRRVVEALLEALIAEKDHESRLAGVQRFALQESGQLAYAGQGPAVVHTLLAPLLKAPTSIDLQDRFLRVIVRAFGDPRLHPGRWLGLPHREIVVGWLTRQSLRQFLDVVDAITVERDAKRSFRYRRAFWEGIYEFYCRNNVPVEAWVVFGPDGASKARQVFKDTAFASLFKETKSVNKDHAVLLFRIADCVIADWNHDGKCNIWSDYEASDAPKLFNRTMRYGTDEIRIGSSAASVETPEHFSIMHQHSESYSWQRRVAERLRVLTNLRIPASTYEIRR